MPTSLSDRPRSSAAHIRFGKQSTTDDSLLTRLRAFDQTLFDYNKHERAITLIMVCISEGVGAPNDIARLLIDLGFMREHVWIMINKGLGNQWLENADGDLVAMPS